MSRLVMALPLAASCVLAAPAFAKVIPFHATMTAANEVPPHDVAGKGVLHAHLNTISHKLTWVMRYHGLTGPATMAHFHGPADAGVNAPIAVPMTGDLKSPYHGTVVLTDEQQQQLLDGKWYANIHTAANPGGEIRGQVEEGK